MDNNIEFILGKEELLHLVKPLWEELNKHHESKSIYFGKSFCRNSFDKRKKPLLRKAENGFLRVYLAKDLTTGEVIGYCISSISSENVGEVESIFVEKEYRKYHIGNTLISDALNWMDENKVKSKIIGVVAGNEEALGFYAKYGFYPSSIILKEKSEE